MIKLLRRMLAPAAAAESKPEAPKEHKPFDAEQAKSRNRDIAQSLAQKFRNTDGEYENRYRAIKAQVDAGIDVLYKYINGKIPTPHYKSEALREPKDLKVGDLVITEKSLAKVFVTEIKENDTEAQKITYQTDTCSSFSDHSEEASYDDFQRDVLNQPKTVAIRGPKNFAHGDILISLDRLGMSDDRTFRIVTNIDKDQETVTLEKVTMRDGEKESMNEPETFYFKNLIFKKLNTPRYTFVPYEDFAHLA